MRVLGLILPTVFLTAFFNLLLMEGQKGPYLSLKKSTCRSKIGKVTQNKLLLNYVKMMNLYKISKNMKHYKV